MGLTVVVCNILQEHKNKYYMDLFLPLPDLQDYDFLIYTLIVSTFSQIGMIAIYIYIALQIC